MLIDNKNNVLETQKQIEKEVVDFYKTLYTSRDDELINVDLNGELHNCTVAKLNDNVSESLEGELTYNVLLGQTDILLNLLTSFGPILVLLSLKA